MNAVLKNLPPSRPKVNQVQRKYLQDRLRAAERDKEYPEEKMPAELVAAKKRYDEWQRKVWARDGSQRKKVRIAAEKARQTILFGTPEEALGAVESFERLSV